MRLIPRIAVIPSNGRDCLNQSLAAIRGQVDHVFLVLNGDSSTLSDWALPNLDDVTGVWSPVSDNISKWWNLGLAMAHGFAADRQVLTWDVAIINDDVIVPEGWFDRVSGVMRQMQVAAACSGGRGPWPVLHTRPGPVNLLTRMQGFAFMMAGEKGLRADEDLVWWAGDDDLDWRARQAGGMVMVPAFHVDHLYPNGQMTPERHVQAAKDMATFEAKWGKRPW